MIHLPCAFRALPAQQSLVKVTEILGARIEQIQIYATNRSLSLSLRFSQGTHDEGFSEFLWGQENHADGLL